MKTFIARKRWSVPILALVALGIALGVASCGKPAGGGSQYRCPMHPTYVSDHPGDCPICGMRLVRIEAKDSLPAEKPSQNPAKPGSDASNGAQAELAPPATRERKILYYRNPMNPSVTSPVPTKDPMGMDYVPVYANEITSQSGGVEGLATVTVDAQAQRLAGIQTAVAQRRNIAHTIRTVGAVVPDETRIRVVHTKVSGWVEKLFVNFTGQLVARGDPILKIYSPELLATQEEYLRARQAVANAVGAPPESQHGGEALLQATRRRLELFDVPENFITELERTGVPQRSVTLAAPSSGFVTTKSVFEGQQVEPGMELFSVTDLSKVWIEAEFYEYEASSVKVGQDASLSLPYTPGSLAGRVSYVYPYVNPETRTLKVRFDFPNHDLTLKPSMYVDVSLRTQNQDGIVIPASAVMDSGVRKIAFVETAPGRFEPREVQLGMRGEGEAQVLSGVQEGEHVVIRANFLLDSESRLRSAISGMSGSKDSTGTGGER
jgi:multidrug efflux pump subunit AcrA (membrane-fusion protein)